MLTRVKWPVLLVVSCVFVAASADDKPPPKAESLDLSAIVQAMSAMPVPTAEEAPAFPDFKEVTKGMVKKEGLFILWHYPPGAADKDSEKLLCQIPAGFLGEQFMLSTSFSGGGFLTGFPLDERVVRWELLDRQLLLVEPETGYVIDRSKEVGDAVRRTYPDRIRVAVPLLTKSPGGDPVIDLGPLLKSNFADIAWTSVFSAPFGGGGGGINTALSKWTKTKAFPLNVEIGVELAMSRMHPPGSYDKKLVHYSFWKLPETDYQPRRADDRVGYFLTVNRDWSKPTSERDIFNRYINRWHLVKRDPGLELCEPRQPITFYIEKTVPVKYRRAVRDGILEWNKAFEKIGFLNAIEVRQQSNDNEWKDLDPEDMRYSFIRWIVSGGGFAMGPSRSNPFTGQIHDADILFDDALVRFTEEEARTQLPETAIQWKLEDPTLARFLEEHPQWRRTPRGWEDAPIGQRATEQAMLRQRVRERMCKCGTPMCDYMQGMRHHMAVAMTMLAGLPQEVIDRYLYDVVKLIVTHEVGHTLGLRHNFKASSVYSMDEIKRRRAAGEATCGSVMDYLPPLLFAENSLEGCFMSPTIGPYDYWAIEYGYRPFDATYKGKAKDEGQTPEKQPDEPAKTAAGTGDAPVSMTRMPLPEKIRGNVSDIPREILDQLPAEIRQIIASGGMQASASGGATAPASEAGLPTFASPPAGEDGMLREIASRAAEPELAFATDEDSFFVAPDPTVALFDMGSDAVEYAEERMQLIDKRLEKIMEWSVRDQESWYHMRRAFLTLMFEKMLVFDYVGRYIGGQYFTRAHRGDPDAQPPFVLVEPERQRAALKFIADHLYSDEFFDIEPSVLNHLAPSRWWHDGSSVSFTLDFPLHRYIAVFQWWNLFDRLFPTALLRIHDNELKTDAPDKLTVAEYIRTLRDACWAEAVDYQRLRGGSWSDARPFVSDVRRSLQREYLALVEPLVRSGPGRAVSPDVHAMLAHSLAELSHKLSGMVNDVEGRLDFASRAHLTECKSRIDRMLSSELKEFERFGFGGGLLMYSPGSTEQPR